MKIGKSILLGTFGAALLMGTTVLLTQRPRPAEPALNSPEPAEAAAQLPAHSATVPEARVASGASVNRSGAVVDLPEIAHKPANALRVRAGVVLAKVNGQPIQLKDLVPLDAQEMEKTMTPEEYDSRLNRAIEMELTFHAALAGGVRLNAEQQQRLNRLAQKHEAVLQELRSDGITWSSVTAAQLEFERRLTFALMLQQNLVALEAHTAPASDPGVQARYEQARSEVLNRLKAHGNVSMQTAEL